MSNYKLFFKYVLFNINYAFINNLAQRSRNTNVCVSNNTLFFLCSHMKMASSFYSTQLCDMLAYEVLLPSNAFEDESGSGFHRNGSSKPQSTVLVYNFHSLQTQNRFFLFVQNTPLSTNSKVLAKNDTVDSISELFIAANWLEREIAELHGVPFTGKKDLRNLMLQYGDSTAPFQKSFPSIGVKELFYSPTKDTLVQNHLSVQI
jgi:NADH:ubiquinone oxidoreductase subunit C